MSSSSFSPSLRYDDNSQQQQKPHMERLVLTFLGYNHHGVRLLQYGEHIGALTQFRKALDLLRNDIMMTTCDDDIETESTTTTPAVSCGDHHPPQQHCHPSPSPLLMTIPIRTQHDDNIMATTSSSSSSVMPMSPHNAFVLYERAFVFDSTMTLHHLTSPSKSSSSSLYHLLYTSALLFNMGIACHRHGLCTAAADQTTYFLKKALGLYQMVGSLWNHDCAGSENIATHNSNCHDTIYHPNDSDRTISDSRRDEEQLEKSLSFVLRLSLWSNMGHLYSHFFMNQEVEQCCVELRKLLHNPPVNPTSFSDDDRYDIHRMPLSEEEYTFFVLNALLMKECSYHRVAPAA